MMSKTYHNGYDIKTIVMNKSRELSCFFLTIECMAIMLCFYTGCFSYACIRGVNIGDRERGGGCLKDDVAVNCHCITRNNYIVYLLANPQQQSTNLTAFVSLLGIFRKNCRQIPNKGSFISSNSANMWTYFGGRGLALIKYVFPACTCR